MDGRAKRMRGKEASCSRLRSSFLWNHNCHAEKVRCVRRKRPEPVQLFIAPWKCQNVNHCALLCTLLERTQLLFEVQRITVRASKSKWTEISVGIPISIDRDSPQDPRFSRDGPTHIQRLEHNKRERGTKANRLLVHFATASFLSRSLSALEL